MLGKESNLIRALIGILRDRNNNLKGLIRKAELFSTLDKLGEDLKRLNKSIEESSNSVSESEKEDA